MCLLAAVAVVERIHLYQLLGIDYDYERMDKIFNAILTVLTGLLATGALGIGWILSPRPPRGDWRSILIAYSAPALFVGFIGFAGIISWLNAWASFLDPNN